jgi:hypothetical protein
MSFLEMMESKDQSSIGNQGPVMTGNQGGAVRDINRFNQPAIGNIPVSYRNEEAKKVVADDLDDILSPGVSKGK